ncbi:hypothetical protein LBMAG46_41490 [Planctomycetia bacterium]|nr:hypothetical protein LBMAG46_41490 [Planctomycetia bacterium]
MNPTIVDGYLLDRDVEVIVIRHNCTPAIPQNCIWQDADVLEGNFLLTLREGD